MLAPCSLPLTEPELHERLLSEFAQGLTHIFPSQHQLQLQGELQHLEDDLIAWGQYYLPHHFQKPSSAMHREVAALLDAASSANAALKLNLLAPRASAKSTLITLTHVLREALTGKQPYIWIISDTKRQAMAHLDNIYAELKDNESLRRRYRRTLPLVRTGNRITLNNACIEAYGTGQRIRGHRWHEHRPTLIICDDLQNDGHIRSAAQRTRSRNWFHAMLMNAGTSRTKVINLGTALHREALAVELHTAPGWTSRRFQAIQQWPTNMHLWAEWEQIYQNANNDLASNNSLNSRGCISAENCEPVHHSANLESETNTTAVRGYPSAAIDNSSDANLTSSRPHIFTSSSQQLAHQFFTEHRDAMEAGSSLLWPEHEDLYTLMSMRAASGPAVFEREKQCIPMNPEECEWPASYFAGDIWFSEWPKDLRLKTIALDPSKGTDAKHGDYSAFAMLGIANDSTIYLEANLARRPTPQIVTDGVELIKHFRPQLFGIETNQFQALLGPEFITALNQAGVVGTNPCSLVNHLPKLVRIRRLGPLLAGKRFKFKSNSPSTKMLLDQLQEFPLSAHDDAPDALEMALRLAENLSQPIPNDGLGNRLIH